MTRKEFLSFIKSKTVILDGATGSNLQKKGMPNKVCPELWIMEHKEALIGLQEEFLEAGSDILYAPTFTANRLKLAEYGLTDRIAELNQGLVGLSKEAVNRFYKKTGNCRSVYIAADLTMTGAQLYPLGKLAFEELVDVYKEQLGYILSAGADLIVIETMMSLQECRAALLAAKEICELPVMVTMTFTDSGRTFYGTDPKTAVIVLQSMGADAVGVNCSTGPDKMLEIVEEMKKYAYIPIIAKPNAGIPKLIGDETVFALNAEDFAEDMLRIVQAGADIVGGCCGTTPEHIKMLANAVKDRKPKTINQNHIRALTTEQNTVEIDIDGRFMLVGERINPTGKKALQEELRSDSLELVAQMASEQTELGADILDINVGMNGIDEKETMLMVMQEVQRVTELPLCIDSSNIHVMEAALRQYPGRALINSISLEKIKYDNLLPIAKKYGAMFILLPLSDRGLPKDINEKKQIIDTVLKRAFSLGLTKEDVVVDGLVNTVGANKNAALDALETIRYCKNELGLATIVGLSNISFGLPERQFINSTFLSFAIQAGLTMAIANPSQDLLVNTAYAADLLRNKEDAAERYIDRVTSRPAQISIGSGNNIENKNNLKNHNNKSDQVNQTSKTANDSCSCGNHGDKNISNSAAADQFPNASGELSAAKEAIFQAVVKGNKKNIVAMVEKELLKGEKPDILIEQTLIPAINEVGRLYDQQRYFLPQLIAGAETMKTAIDYLEPKLTKNDQEKSKGCVVIATVSGDIHDIGKNLVALMLKNYGFRVIDLGKDVPSEKIVETAKKENADIIALSALMTTTMVEMKTVVQMVKSEGVKAKVIIGGAVITQGYAKEIGADGYSEDAQAAVALVKKLIGKKE